MIFSEQPPAKKDYELGYSAAARFVAMLNNQFTDTGDVLTRRALDTFRSLSQ